MMVIIINVVVIVRYFNVYIQNKLLWHTPVMGTHSGYQPLLEVSDKEGVVAIHLPIGPLKTFPSFHFELTLLITWLALGF